MSIRGKLGGLAFVRTTRRDFVRKAGPAAALLALAGCASEGRRSGGARAPRFRKPGDRLNIGVRTIETHRERIMRRLNIHSVAGLTKYAIANGLITLEGAPQT